MRLLLLALLLAGTASSLSAQASPFVPLDDPLLPLFEHLVARGDVADPSPMIRPFRRGDARRVLREARDTTDAGVRELLAWWAEPATPPTGTDAEAVQMRLEARAGVQAATQARRDLLRVGGDGNAWPYADLRLEGRWGPVVLVARPGVESRVKNDPDWPGRRENLFSGRLFEGYASLQAGPARLTIGQSPRNWGPVGLPGLAVSDVTYRRDGWALDLVSRTVQFTSYGSQLTDATDSLGRVVKRYFVTKRIGARVSDRLHVGLWESTVIQGVDRSFDLFAANPLSFVYTTITYGYGDREGGAGNGTNNIVGVDAAWRFARRHTAALQFALDDFWYDQRDVNRDRLAGTLQVTGPLGTRAGYRASYSLVSAFAYRTFNAFENFTDGRVGLARNFTDNDQLTLQVTVPVGRRWLLTPEVTHLRQGEGRLATPYPTPPLDPVANPFFLIGTRERTLRAALGVSGRSGPLEVLANVGVHRIANAGNVPGVQLTRGVARLQATYALRYAGWAR